MTDLIQKRSAIPTHRHEDPMFQRRLEVLTASKMHADAVRICQLARTLKGLVDDFSESYMPEAGFDLFIAARCTIPTDISEEGTDENREWSKWVYEDVTGFRWGLKMFLSALSANLSIPDDGTDDEDVTPMIVGERGAS